MAVIMQSIEQEKKELRKKLLAMLLSLSIEEIKRRSSNVAKNLSNLHIYRKAKTIMVYFPLKGEVNLLGLIRQFSGEKRFCFPVMDTVSKTLKAFEVLDLDRDFLPGPYGVMQPDVKRLTEISLEDIDLVIVPGLAFDRSLNRLGRGGGFYDRFLTSAPAAVNTVGVGFDFQILEFLPVNPSQDAKVGAIACETALS